MAPLTRTLRGNRGQCASCGEYFNSTSAFDKHRIGSFAKDTRRCMSQDEMRAAGMTLPADGFWRGKEMPENGLRSFPRKAKQRAVALGHTPAYPGA